MRRTLLLVAICGLLTAPLASQVASPQPDPAKTMPGGVAQPRLTPPGNVDPLLAQLEQTASAANNNISRLRIDKWKTDGNYKRQASANAESVQRNLTAALPGMIASVRSAPDNLAASFKLYRNLNALYDVLSSLAESTGAFGPREDYEALAADAGRLDQIRRQMADQIEKLANFKDAEVSQLMLQIRAQAAAAAAAPPKKIVVDEEEPVKKPAKKKKAPAKPAAQQPPAQPSQNPPPK